jgi:hypothetical protein
MSIIKTTGNTRVATMVANGIAKGLLHALRAKDMPITGKVMARDDEGTFYPESPVGRFLVTVQSGLTLSRTGIERVLSVLEPSFSWKVEPRGKDTFLITAVPTDWGYREHLKLLSTEELMDEIVWRVGS